MPELPPPPPPPLSLAGVLLDAGRRAFTRNARPFGPVAVAPTSTDSDVAGAPSSPWPWFSSPPARVVPPLVVACVALALALGGGWLLLQRIKGGSHPPEVTLPRASASPPAVAAGTPDDTAGTADGEADQPRGPVTVHAAGAVAQPGVYRLSPGARVADLIQAAGGATADAEVDALNLAARLHDGERIYVPHRGQLPPGALLATGGVDGAGNGSPAGPTADGRSPPGRPVDLNTATLEQLDALPGVGPTTAQAILDHRRSHGRFRSVDELLEVRGIGPSRLEALRKKVHV